MKDRKRCRGNYYFDSARHWECIAVGLLRVGGTEKTGGSNKGAAENSAACIKRMGGTPMMIFPTFLLFSYLPSITFISPLARYATLFSLHTILVFLWCPTRGDVWQTRQQSNDGTNEKLNFLSNEKYWIESIEVYVFFFNLSVK